MKLYLIIPLLGVTLLVKAQSNDQPKPVVISNTQYKIMQKVDERSYKRNMTWYIQKKPWRLVLQYNYVENGITKQVERTLDITDKTPEQREAMIQAVEDSLNLPKYAK